VKNLQHCSVWQYAAVCCSVLHFVAVCWCAVSGPEGPIRLLETHSASPTGPEGLEFATHCNILQQTQRRRPAPRDPAAVDGRAAEPRAAPSLRCRSSLSFIIFCILCACVCVCERECVCVCVWERLRGCVCTCVTLCCRSSP